MQRSPIRLPGAALVAALLALAATACDRSKPPPSTTASPPPSDDGPAPGVRLPAVPEDHPLYARFEGTGFDNACEADANCVASGCSGEVCSATPGVITTCEVLPVSLPPNTACGCVESECIWWNAEGATLPPVEDPPPASCATVLCPPPTVCLEYYGMAGPAGPKLVSCEIPCGEEGDSCPAGMECVTIPDGPGSVCRNVGQ